MKNNNYFLGLDIGTNSVGYAVTDENYALIRHRGEPMWGAHIFEEAKLRDARRQNRTNRRRIDRKQLRVQLTQEIFAKEICKLDSNFFKRLSNSRLLRADTDDEYIFFNDEDYNDGHYFCNYPTIHHLISELMRSNEPHDVRLVYLACVWLVVHRGHFLSEINKENVDKITDFSDVYDSLIQFFEDECNSLPWSINDKKGFENILRSKSGVNDKKKAFYALLYDGKKQKDDFSSFPYSKDGIINLLAGGKVKADKLFGNPSYSEIEQKDITLGMKDEEFEKLYNNIGDDAELVRHLKAIYDWSLLVDLLGNDKYISDAKIRVYDQHKSDLKILKHFIRKYAPEKFSEVFRNNGKSNYVAYSGNTKYVKNLSRDFKKCLQGDFCKYIKGIVKGFNVTEDDRKTFDDMLIRLEKEELMPKQVTSDNRVIPYQLYWKELDIVLNKASTYLPFLNDTEDGITCADKIRSIFEFRVPYFVGPLVKTDNNNAWIVRKAGKIYPWNFEEMVDLDKSEEEFIKRLTNYCTFYPGKKVLPKNSLCYSAFTVLNQINSIKVGETKISVEVKQKIFNELFLRRKSVTLKAIKNFLLSEGIVEKSDVDTISGVDEKVTASLTPFIAFKRIREEKMLDDTQIERIIERMACTEDRSRLEKWLKQEFPDLSEKDQKYISGLKFKDFGRLSREFLCELYGADKKAGTGEAMSIMDALWETNNNLMELLSNNFTFKDQLEAIRQEYYASNPKNLDDKLDEMWISNAVKRPIIRTLDIVSDVVKATGRAPTKIFVEMARTATAEGKGKRTVSRRQKLEALYKDIGRKAKEISEKLENLAEADNRLQSDKLYLYFMQLGKDMYTGDPITLESVIQNDGTYNIEHIYPQAYVKDDSIENNKVLVNSKVNGEKKDVYPIDSAIREKMRPVWDHMLKAKLITEEKYKRLIRSTPFTSDEKMGFINRQFVETTQSTKAVAAILKEKYPDTEIVYVKAGLVSDFRHQFDMLKSRQLNDLHHAKDAYLNVVVGNVYHEKFTSRWFNVNSGYSIKTETVFGNKQWVNGALIWGGGSSIDAVRKVMRKNNAHYTRYSFCRAGALFDVKPLKASDKLFPLKAGLDPAKYGGYNKTTVSFFTLVRYKVKNEYDLMIMPVELLFSKQFLEDDEFAMEYSKRTVSSILNKPVTDLSMPLGKRIIKVNTMLSLDGFRVCITGKAGGGKSIIIMPMMPLAVSKKDEEYIKRLESVKNKLSKNANYKIDEKFDKITADENIALYDLMLDKLKNTIYSKRPNNPWALLNEKREKFKDLSIKDQLECLLQILSVLNKMTGGCDLTYIGEGKHAAATGNFSNKASNWRKYYKDVRIIDMSASGIYETRSCNLFKLI